MRRCAIVLAVLGGIVLLPAWCLAEAPLSERLPAGALAYAGWAGKNLPFDGSMFGQLLGEPACAQITGAVYQALGAKATAGARKEIFKHGWELAAIGWQHPLAVALIDLQMGPKTAPVASAAMVIDLGGDREAFARHLDALLAAVMSSQAATAPGGADGNVVAAAAGKGNAVTLGEAAVGKVAYKTVRLAGGVELSLGYIDNLFFLATGPGVAAQLIELTAGRSLKSDKHFTDIMDSVWGDNVQVAYFVDIAAMSKRIGPPQPQSDAATGDEARPFKKALGALGLGDVTAEAGTVRLVDRGLYTKSKLLGAVSHKGLLLPLTGTSLTEADLEDVPQDADIAAAFSLSPDAALGEFQRILRELKPPAAENVDLAVEGIDSAIGISLRADVLANLGETWVLSSAPSQGGLATGTLLSVNVKDPNKLQEALARIEAFVKERSGQAACGPAGFRGPSIETIKTDKVEIHYLMSGRRGTWAVAPAWALYKNRLYVAAWPQVIEAAIENAGKSPLTQLAAFQQLQSRVSNKPSVLVYVNSPKVVREVYQVLLIGWTVGCNELSRDPGAPFRPDWLPPLTSMEKYLWPEIFAVSCDADGIVFEDYGSTPSIGALAPAWFGGILPIAARRGGQLEQESSRK